VTSGSINWGPVWSPGSERIAYGSVRGGPSQVYQRGLTGALQETSIWKSAEFVGPTGWLPDGKAIVLLDATHYRVGVLALNPSSSPTWVSNTAFVEGDGRVSPDGQWLAYTSNESGTWDVYVKAFPSLDQKWRVSPAGGSGPTWRSDSAELYYIDRDQHLMAVKVRRAPTPLEGPPTRLFALPVVPTPPGIDPRLMYAPTSSGDRFLVNSAVEAGSQLPLTIVSNILERLRDRTR
jgi:Tol biopolymer transport system component